VKNSWVYIATALECIDLIMEYTSGLTQDAVVRNFEVIGQAPKDYGLDALKEKRPDIPWSQITGMRNVLAHEYLGVDMILIWDTVKLHLNELKQALENF